MTNSNLLNSHKKHNFFAIIIINKLINNYCKRIMQYNNNLNYKYNFASYNKFKWTFSIKINLYINNFINIKLYFCRY